MHTSPGAHTGAFPAPSSGFTTIERVVRQYRSDVNRLEAPASAAALTALEGHLGRALPAGLRTFLLRHNGADLLRGTLRLRSTAEIATATSDAPEVVLFADGPGEVRWAFAHEPGGSVFGTWDGAALTPLHATFGGWLRATMAVLESRVVGVDDQDDLRFEADPTDVFQLLRQGIRALHSGRPERAETLLREVTTRDPSRVVGWQYLGDALAITDRTAARQAWLQAFRRTSFPLRWPGEPCIDPEVVRSLERAFTDPEAWEAELARFLDERVTDVRAPRAAEVVLAAGRALAASRVRRGRRRDARDALAALVSRCHGFGAQPAPWEAILELAQLEIDLGSHDEAEALLRRVRRQAPAPWPGRALLALAGVALLRQEPWVDDILDEARHAGLDEPDTASWHMIAAERAMRHEQHPLAEKHVAEAAALARRVALPRLTARVRLAEGDQKRATGDWKGASDAWAQGTRLLASRPDAELTHRLRSRLGDAAAAAGDRREAEHHYTAAAAGFREHELVVREAWVLLRLARLRRGNGRAYEDALHAALSRFKEADLATGVAAHDAVLGDPGAHLDWHLSRARDHARARYDAQRARPPYERADADRPERRLGAHRLAIAACTDEIVGHLARRMDTAVRAIEAGRLAPKDDAVLSYVGAADLLSGHRSWAASEVLLRHLMEQRVDGHAWKALQGAIARSPNAALVHGLLEHLEVPTGKPAPALAAAAELLGLRRESHAVGPLLQLARRPHSPTVRKAAIVALGRIGDRRALEVVAEGLPEPKLAEAAALALLLLGDRRGLDFHGKALVERSTDPSSLPGEIVGRYGGPEHLLLLIGASDGDGPVAIGALQGLGLLGDSRAVPVLLNALSRRDAKIVDVASGALELITGHQDDGSPGFRARWHTWWEQHAARFPDGVRTREGRVFGLDFLLERMRHDDPWVRRTAFDELCITTGERLPFDADGPWRTQVAHLRAWRTWWIANKERYLPGRWYLDGKRVG